MISQPKSHTQERQRHHSRDPGMKELKLPMSRTLKTKQQTQALVNQGTEQMYHLTPGFAATVQSSQTHQATHVIIIQPYHHPHNTFLYISIPHPHHHGNCLGCHQAMPHSHYSYKIYPLHLLLLLLPSHPLPHQLMVLPLSMPTGGNKDWNRKSQSLCICPKEWLDHSLSKGKLEKNDNACVWPTIHV